MTNALPADFKAWYFDFLTQHADPASGYFRCSAAWPELCSPSIATLPVSEPQSQGLRQTNLRGADRGLSS
jgi:hypothetical protein